MVISSRTPEGAPHHCPICHHDIQIEPSRPTLDGPCPHCGHLLWFGGQRPPDRRQQLIHRVLELGSERFGPPRPEIRVAIESVAETERLVQLARLAVQCPSWQELAAALASEPVDDANDETAGRERKKPTNR